MTSPDEFSGRVRSRFHSLLRCTALSALAIRHVLELGCGDHIDPAAYPPDARIVGIDIDRSALRRARAASSNPRLYVAQADISHLPLRELGFDLIVARHPDVDAHYHDWWQTLTTAPDWLALDGRLLVTCYAPHEAETIRAWIASTPLVQWLVDESQLAPPDLAGRDRFVLAFRRAIGSKNDSQP